MRTSRDRRSTDNKTLEGWRCGICSSILSLHHDDVVNSLTPSSTPPGFAPSHIDAAKRGTTGNFPRAKTHKPHNADGLAFADRDKDRIIQPLAPFLVRKYGPTLIIEFIRENRAGFGVRFKKPKS